MSELPEEQELERLEQELEPLLGETEVPSARPAFRAQLARAFLAGEESESVEPGEDAVGETLRAGLDLHGDVPAARGEFRESLRESFLAAGAARGAGGLRALPAASGTDGEAPAGEAPLPRTRAPEQRRSWALGLASTLAAAAAVVLLVLSGVLGPQGEAGASWSIAAVEGSLDEVFLGEQPLGQLSRDEVAELLAAGGEVRTGSSRARLVLDRTLVVELGPDSSVGLAALDGEDAMAFTGNQGQLLFATGPDYRSQDGLMVTTAEAEVRPLGTLFAIDLYEEGTCVCCEEGEVLLRSLLTGEDQLVARHGLGFVDSDDGELHSTDILHDHQEPLASLEEALSELW